MPLADFVKQLAIRNRVHVRSIGKVCGRRIVLLRLRSVSLARVTDTQRICPNTASAQQRNRPAKP